MQGILHIYGIITNRPIDIQTLNIPSANIASRERSGEGLRLLGCMRHKSWLSNGQVINISPLFVDQLNVYFHFIAMCR